MAIESGLYHPEHYDRRRPVGSYWEATGGPEPTGVSHSQGDIAVEVAIVGGGYTGLSAAYHLARDHGIQAAVLEAGAIGWGASGRNGGFCGLGGSKLGYGPMAQRYGVPEAARFFAAQKAGVALVRSLAADEGIDIEPAGEGEHYVAHRAEPLARAREHRPAPCSGCSASAGSCGARPRWRSGCCARRRRRDAWSCRTISACIRCATCGGWRRPRSRRGARVHARTPVNAWQQAGGRHRLATPAGTVTAERVLFATNGYTPEGLDPALAGLLLPALSSIIVTRPLTPAEQAAQGWTRPALIADSRKLLFYIRLLRDGRLLFGARGGLDASPAAFARQRAWMERRLGEKFPAWRGVADRLRLVGSGLPRPGSAAASGLARRRRSGRLAAMGLSRQRRVVRHHVRPRGCGTPRRPRAGPAAARVRADAAAPLSACRAAARGAARGLSGLWHQGRVAVAAARWPQRRLAISSQCVSSKPARS